MKWSRRQAIGATLALGAGVPGLGWALSKPSGPVVLTVKGKGVTANDAGAAQFDMAMLERMPQRSTTTKTPWYEGPKKFTGPLLRDVLAAAGAKGTTLRAVALNDYKVDIPFDEKPELRVPQYFSRCAWQLRTLEVL